MSYMSRSSRALLETARLTLRYITLYDAPFMLEVLNEPSFKRNIGDRQVRTVEQARAYLLERIIPSYEKNGYGLYVVELKDTRTPIGICTLFKRDNLIHPDIGFAFFERYWRLGYAYESASAVMNYAKEILSFTDIYAIVSPGNATSIRLLEKLGLRFDCMVKMPSDDHEIQLFSLKF